MVRAAEHDEVVRVKQGIDDDEEVGTLWQYTDDVQQPMVDDQRMEIATSRRPLETQYVDDLWLGRTPTRSFSHDGNFKSSSQSSQMVEPGKVG